MVTSRGLKIGLARSTSDTRLYVAYVFLVCVLAACSVTQQEATSVQRRIIELCPLQVQEPGISGNASFNVVYAFDVGPDGTPTNIRAVSSKFVEEDLVRKCLENWRLPEQAEKTRLGIIFRWEHAKGWVSLVIFGEHLSEEIRISGDLSPY